MDRTFPALEVTRLESDLLLAELDDYSPTAAEERGGATRVFFLTSDSRDRAVQHLRACGIAASSLDVPDEDWARRSQENIPPVVVGNVCVTPPWHLPRISASAGQPIAKSPNHPITKFTVVVIEPSMGFGTGHHATTRLCLRALQNLPLEGKDVVDVGTGSGVLAIAASLLGARSVLGLDNDPDALLNARENLTLNASASNVRFEAGDLARSLAENSADVLLANLTGALLARAADRLIGAVRPGGTIILSGLMTAERAGVESAFGAMRLLERLEEDEWAALVLAKR